jgi:hypothetical protein
VNRIVIVVVSVAFGLVLAWAIWPRRTLKTKGNASKIEVFVSLLMRSPDQKFLIVGIAGTEDFIQLIVAPDRAQIDFPLITERQRSLEPRILQVAGQLHFDFYETRGSNGGRFLDCDFVGSSREIADTCRKLLIHVYGISDTTPLTFETDASI